MTHSRKTASINPDELSNPRRVNVFLEGGIVQNIEVPEGVEVHVYDYDLEGLDADRIETDALGDSCAITVWGATHDDGSHMGGK